jgi:hypothetical protein
MTIHFNQGLPECSPRVRIQFLHSSRWTALPVHTRNCLQNGSVSQTKKKKERKKERRRKKYVTSISFGENQCDVAPKRRFCCQTTRRYNSEGCILLNNPIICVLPWRYETRLDTSTSREIWLFTIFDAKQKDGKILIWIVAKIPLLEYSLRPAPWRADADFFYASPLSTPSLTIPASNVRMTKG